MAARRPVAPQLFTLNEAAERLGTSHDSVRRLIDGGELEAIDVSAGGTRPRLRVSETALGDFISRRTLPKPQARPRAARTGVVRIAAEPNRRSS